MSASTFVQRLVALLGTLLLAACAGTIQRESGAGARRVEGATYTGVEIVLSEDARRAQKDNPLFNARELGEYVRKQIESRDLLNAQGTHRVEVTIEHMRVRSAAAAVLLGVMAGADSIVKPREPGLPTDPSERALLMCERSAKQPCKLYAVNHAVVWARASD
jgi:hypothetical protein